MTELTHEERMTVTREMGAFARRVAEVPVTVVLKAQKRKSIPSAAVSFYTQSNPAALVANLCDEILRLRGALHQIADGPVFKKWGITDRRFAASMLDGRCPYCLRGPEEDHDHCGRREMKP